MLSLLNIVYQIISPIFLVVGLAVLVGRRLAPDPRAIAQLAVYLFTPFLVMDSMAQSELQMDEMGTIAVTVVFFSVLFVLLGKGLSVLLRFDNRLESAFILSIVLMNTGNFGLPLSEFAFGAQGLQRAVVVYVAMTLVTNSLGVYLASRGSASVVQSLRNVLTVPLFYAAFFGLLLNLEFVRLPLPLARVMSLLGQAAVPSMLVTLGLQLAHASIRGQWTAIFLATLARLAVAPFLAYLLATLVGLSGLTRQVVVVQVSMPTAVISTVLSTEFGSDAEFTTAVVVVSTLASVVTLSVLLYVLG